ncbi:hypothetical protein UCRPC4_g01132 [Phaeomoniella chlamydospora]|uniref:Uncharacterized protein n=1 Tax=Phaeomoniella chlamydospora TaxID=158046 RepID=A0A0G2EXL0_PHACM|nr:hypothetical protein UCRPC4_g01132 [Phaeomoniella chlamydospora]
MDVISEGMSPVEDSRNKITKAGSSVDMGSDKPPPYQEHFDMAASAFPQHEGALPSFRGSDTVNTEDERKAYTCHEIYAAEALVLLHNTDRRDQSASDRSVLVADILHQHPKKRALDANPTRMDKGIQLLDKFTVNKFTVADRAHVQDVTAADFTALSHLKDRLEVVLADVQKAFHHEKNASESWKAKVQEIKGTLFDLNQVLSRRNNEIRDLKSQIKTSREHRLKAESELQQLQKRSKEQTEATEENSRLHTIIAETQSQLADIKEQMATLAAQKADLSERACSLTEEKSKFDRRLDGLLNKKYLIQNERDELHTKLNIALEEKAALEGRLRQLPDRNTEQRESKLQSLRSECERMQVNAKENKYQLTYLKKDLDASNSSNQHLRAAITEKDDFLHNLKKASVNEQQFAQAQPELQQATESLSQRRRQSDHETQECLQVKAQQEERLAYLQQELEHAQKRISQGSVNCKKIVGLLRSSQMSRISKDIELKRVTFEAKESQRTIDYLRRGIEMKDKEIGFLRRQISTLKAMIVDVEERFVRFCRGPFDGVVAFSANQEMISESKEPVSIFLRGGLVAFDDVEPEDREAEDDGSEEFADSQEVNLHDHTESWARLYQALYDREHAGNRAVRGLPHPGDNIFKTDAWKKYLTKIYCRLGLFEGQSSTIELILEFMPNPGSEHLVRFHESETSQNIESSPCTLEEGNSLPDLEPESVQALDDECDSANIDAPSRNTQYPARLLHYNDLLDSIPGTKLTFLHRFLRAFKSHNMTLRTAAEFQDNLDQSLPQMAIRELQLHPTALHGDTDRPLPAESEQHGNTISSAEGGNCTERSHNVSPEEIIWNTLRACDWGAPRAILEPGILRSPQSAMFQRDVEISALLVLTCDLGHKLHEVERELAAYRNSGKEEALEEQNRESQRKRLQTEVQMNTLKRRASLASSAKQLKATVKPFVPASTSDVASMDRERRPSEDGSTGDSVQSSIIIQPTTIRSLVERQNLELSDHSPEISPWIYSPIATFPEANQHGDSVDDEAKPTFIPPVQATFPVAQELLKFGEDTRRIHFGDVVDDPTGPWHDIATSSFGSAHNTDQSNPAIGTTSDTIDDLKLENTRLQGALQTANATIKSLTPQLFDTSAQLRTVQIQVKDLEDRLTEANRRLEQSNIMMQPAIDMAIRYRGLLFGMMTGQGI